MDIKESYSIMKKQNETVKEYLIGKGIAEKDIVFNAITNYEDYSYDWNESARQSVRKFNGYQLTQSVRIESKEVEKIEKISREISELLDSNIQINANYIEYYYTKLADLKIAMLEQATLDAKKRAETITNNAGSRLAGLKTANMGVFQITAPNSSDDYSWGGTFNTSSKEKRASINMRLTYYVK
ncbi:MAG: SIMPL domain-containing protein [Bacteroidales bacterium]|nr:SIMPL domain-containing protein [Bacteroidales bacterium]